jgi:hypothetical protein
MISNAKTAYPTTFSWNGNVVAELTEISAPETEVSMHEVTNNDSAGWVEKIAGLISGGEFSIKGNFIESDTDGQIALQVDHIAKTVRTAVIALPAAFGTQLSMSSICTKFKPVTPMDGSAASFEATFEVTGQVAFTTSSSTGLTTPFFTVADGTIVPAAANDVYTYAVSVAAEVSTTTITPTAEAGTITVDGNTVVSGEASSTVTLGAAGSLTTATIVVAETGKSPVTYKLYIARAA